MSQLVNQAPGFQHGQTRHDNAGIMDSQRALAEVTEMVHAAHQIHLSLLDVSGRDQSPRGDVSLSDISKRDQSRRGKTSSGEVADVEFGNKLSILSGDLLLAKACVGLARLHTPKVGGAGGVNTGMDGVGWGGVKSKGMTVRWGRVKGEGWGEVG